MRFSCTDIVLIKSYQWDLKMNKKELERKLKREIIEVCLNCAKLTNCDDIGKFVECSDFEEVEDDAWVIRKLE